MPTIAYFHIEDAPDWPADAGLQLAAALLASRADVRLLGDLARLAADGDPALAALAAADDLRIVSPFYPRAVRWLMHAAGADLSADVDCVVTQGREVGDVLAELFGETPPEPTDAHRDEASQRLAALRADDDWRAWFPVVDYDRCVNCGQCTAFCLFGVYTDSPQRVLVARPANCKNNCPACARVCPHQAIIFPKHTAAPINANDAASADPDVLPGVGDLRDPDVMDKLRQRAAAARAAAERNRAQRDSE